MSGRQSSSSSRTKAWRLSWGGNQRIEVGTTQAVLGPKECISGAKAPEPPRQPTPWRRTRTAPGGGRQNGAHPRERGCEGWRSGGGGVGQSMEIRAFRCWAGCHFGNGRTRRVWVLSALEKEAKGAGRHGVRRGVASINDDSDRGVKVFLKVRVLSAEREGLVRALMGGGGQWCHRDDFDNGSRFLAGIELLGQKLHAGDPTKTGPWSCG